MLTSLCVPKHAHYRNSFYIYSVYAKNILKIMTKYAIINLVIKNTHYGRGITLDILGINAEIEEAKRRRQKLNNEKKEKESKVKSGEGLFDNLTTFRKKTNTSLNDFEDKLNLRCSNRPGNFGAYYKRQVQSALKEGNAYSADEMVSDILNAIKNSIFDLDEAIDTLKAKINDINTLLKQLGQKLEDAKDVFEDMITGGDD